MNTLEAESEMETEVVEYVPMPDVIEMNCLAFQASWTDEQREAARRGLPRQSSPIVLASPMAQRRLAAGRVWHKARRDRLRDARPVVAEEQQSIRHYPDIASPLKWEARFNREVRLPGGRRSYFGRRKAFATREEAVAWRRGWIERWERQGGSCGLNNTTREMSDADECHAG
jgi:hypothetical protein